MTFAKSSKLDNGLKHTSIVSLALDLFCVTFNGLSKSHMVCGFCVGWMVFSGNKEIGRDYINGVNILSNMCLYSNVPGQSIIQTALGGYQSVNEYIVPGGRIHEQRELVYQLLNDIPGISVKKPKATIYILPKIDVKRFNIAIVYLPRPSVLKEATGGLREFLEAYHQ